MPEEKEPILDPERELPVPHDMSLESGPKMAGELEPGYAAQLDPANIHKATLPLTHYQNLPRPGFFSRNKYLLFLLPLILFIGSAAFATYYVSDAQRREQMPQPTLSMSSGPTAVQTQQPTPTVDPTAHWKTYTSTYGYTLQYPPEASLVDCKGKCNYESQLKYKDLLITFVPFGISKNQTIPTYAASGFCKGPGTVASQATINTVFFYRFENLVPANNICLNAITELHQLPVTANVNSKWILDIQAKAYNQNGKTLFDQMLSTFRFVAEATPEGKMCGGIAGIQCAAGMSCQLDGTYPDAGGHCVVGKPTSGLSVKPTTGPASASKQVEDLARGDLAHKLGEDIDTIQVLSSVAKEWSDSSLGCPKPGVMYSQVVTPGYAVTLFDGSNQYTYHTDSKTRVVACE